MVATMPSVPSFLPSHLSLYLHQQPAAFAPRHASSTHQHTPISVTTVAKNMARHGTILLCLMVLAFSSQTQARQLTGSNFLLPTLTPPASGSSTTGGSTPVGIASTDRAYKANAEPPRVAPAAAGGSLLRAVAGGAWQVTATTITFNPLSNVRVLSPLCAAGQEATSCSAFSGNTAVVLSSVMPAVGSSTNVKTTQCFCDFRNTLGVVLPANGGEVYRCVAYCQ